MGLWHLYHVVLASTTLFQLIQAGCDQEVKTDGALISSPGFLLLRHSNALCEYSIRSPPSSTVEVTFHAFDLGTSRNCEYDSLQIFDGSSTANTPVLFSDCGKVPTPFSVSSSGSNMLLLFRSGPSSPGIFVAKVNFLTKESPTAKPLEGKTTTKEYDVRTELHTYMYTEDLTTSVTEYPDWGWAESLGPAYYEHFGEVVYDLPDSLVRGACPEYWYQREDYCYFLERTSGNFSYVEQLCENRGAQLASIHDSDEQAYVYDLFFSLPFSGYYYWMGLFRDMDTGNWRFVDDTELDYTNWFPNRPNGGLMENCVRTLAVAAGEWDDYPCSRHAGGVCKAALFDIYETSQPIALIDCADGWTMGYNAGLYCYVQTRLHWDAAKNTCQELGGHLLTIEDVREQQFINQATGRGDFYGELIWIGISYNEIEGVWLSAESQSPLTYYSEWDTRYSTGNCGTMSTAGSFWYRDPCDRELVFICEK